HVDAVGEKESAMEELQLERQILAAPHRLLRQKADGAIAVVAEILEVVRQRCVRRLKGLERQIMRHPAHGEGIEGRALVRGRSGGARQRSKEGQHGSCEQEIATAQAQSSIGCREEPRSTVWVVWNARTAGLPELCCMR